MPRQTKKPKTKRWQRIALLVAGGYAGLLALSRLAYRVVLYPAPSKGLELAPAGAELRTYTAADGVPVQALVFPSAGGRTIVFFHGNGETIADSVDLAAELAARGLGFVSVEYRGYGAARTLSTASPSEDGLYHDAEAVLQGLRATGFERDDIVLWGSSLGSGIAVEMAIRGYGSRLILATPYTSIPDVAARFVPFLPTTLIIGDHFDNLAKAPRLNLPTLILHGDKDRLVPYRMGVRLSKAIAGAELITVSGGGHNDLFVVARQRLLAAVQAHASR